MKKAISLILAILTIFSVMSMSVAAADKVTWCSNDEHDWYEISRVKATCADVGGVTYKCTKCTLGIKHETLAKLPHKDETHDGICEVCRGDSTLDCKCYCHTVKDGRTGILTPFAIFMQFFASIFKINHYCDCGYHQIYK